MLRGVVALVESLKIGFKALNISANAQMPEDEEGEREEIGGGTWVGTIVVALAFAVGLFFLLPAGLTNLFKDSIPNGVVFVVIEKLVRISIFLVYIVLISRLRDLRRVFEYHGAEHKTISCYEAGPGPDARERPALLAAAPPLRHQLPADRDDRGHLRVRPAGQARLAVAVRVARRGHPDRGRHRLRGHQVAGPQPHQALGAGADVARASSSSG